MKKGQPIEVESHVPLDMGNKALIIHNLQAHFFTPEGVVKALNGVSLDLPRDSILGITGESGCGKTVTALCILGLLPRPGRIIEGEIYYKGYNLLTLDPETMRHLRGRELAIIFQEPLKALNPLKTVGPQVEEVLTTHLEISHQEARERSLEIMQGVGLSDPERIASQFPFQLSVGMCQRVMLAIALALDPEILIADEPTSSLDMTLQAEMLLKMKQFQERKHSSLMLITHNLGVMAQMADEVAVMYAGTVVERAPAVNLFQSPAHPYTWSLLRCVPRLDTPRRPLSSIRGSAPDLLNLPDQCAFLPRCPKARNECRFSPRPPLREIGPGHTVACYNEVRHDWAPL